MVDAALIDWEGVLADTAAARRDALLRALDDEGVPFRSLEYVAHCEGRAVHVAAAQAFESVGRNDPTLMDLVALRATRAFAERLGKGFVLMPGARELVERLQSTSRLGIVTTATRTETEFVLRLAGLDAAVSIIVSADDGLALPPAPAMYERAVEMLRRVRPMQRNRVIAIAPTSAALRAARAAGLRTIAVGAPAHVAVDADGAVTDLVGVTTLELTRLAGIAAVERTS